MKKLIIVLTLFLVLSTNFVVLADGDGHIPGYQCPDPLVECSEPEPTPCPPTENCSNGASAATPNTEEEPQDDSFGDYLRSLFGI